MVGGGGGKRGAGFLPGMALCGVSRRVLWRRAVLLATVLSWAGQGNSSPSPRSESDNLLYNKSIDVDISVAEPIRF